MRTEAYRVGPDGEWLTHVYLSRRNLESLLAKLNGSPPHSACTIKGPVFYPATVVTAEEDDVHYAHESREGEPPGRMHPDTEVSLSIHNATREEEK